MPATPPPAPSSRSHIIGTCAVVGAFVLVAVGITLERSQGWPFRGLPAAVYPVDPNPNKPVIRRVLPSRSSSSRSSARSSTAGSAPWVAASSRASVASSASSQRTIAASASSRPTWTGDECETFHPSHNPDACKRKMFAILQGDGSCLADSDCRYAIDRCSEKDNECRAAKIARWSYQAMMPSCNTAITAECQAMATALVATTLPASLKSCLGSHLCRELLAEFRRVGDFACRQYDPCLAAIAAVRGESFCAEQPWCKSIAAIDDLFTSRAKECTTPLRSAECRKKLGIDTYALGTERAKDCKVDLSCDDAIEDMQRQLGDDYDHGMFSEPNPACFLWKDCRDAFDGGKQWACSTPGREMMCKRYTKVEEYLTKTRPSCVTSALSTTCKRAIIEIQKNPQ